MKLDASKYKKTEKNTHIVITLNEGAYGIVDGNPAITVDEARRIAETTYRIAMETLKGAGILEITDEEEKILDALWREQDIYLYRAAKSIIENAEGKTTGWS